MVVVRLRVDLPVETVFDYFLDFRNENQWNVVAHDIVLLTDLPIAVGSRFSGQYDRMGQMEYEIQEFDRPRFASVTGNAKLFRHFQFRRGRAINHRGMHYGSSPERPTPGCKAPHGKDGAATNGARPSVAEDDPRGESGGRLGSVPSVKVPIQGSSRQIDDSFERARLLE
jgi:hypothetical protein